MVGLVTKYAGSVVKGFSLIAGMNPQCLFLLKQPLMDHFHFAVSGILITGVAQFLLDGKPLGMKDA